MTIPCLGQTVIYRSRTGDYSLPAIVTATLGSINRAGVEAGKVPDLDSIEHVHLAVFTPGLPPRDTPATTITVIDPTRPLGERVVDTDTPEGHQFRALTAFGGTYAEHNIGCWDHPGMWQYDEQPPGTWAPTMSSPPELQGRR